MQEQVRDIMAEAITVIERSAKLLEQMFEVLELQRSLVTQQQGYITDLEARLEESNTAVVKLGTQLQHFLEGREGNA